MGNSMPAPGRPIRAIKPSPITEAEMRAAGTPAKIMVGLAGRMVVIDLGRAVQILAFTAEEARGVAKSLIQRADIAEAAAKGVPDAGRADQAGGTAVPPN